jgi:hypothetical protein
MPAHLGGKKPPRGHPAEWPRGATVYHFVYLQSAYRDRMGKSEKPHCRHRRSAMRLAGNIRSAAVPRNPLHGIRTEWGRKWGF